MEVPLSHYQLCLVFHKDPCWCLYCSLPTLTMSQIILSNGSLLLYADDIVLYRPIYCQEDYNSLRNDVDSLCDWTSSAFLNLNAAKCKYMVISRKKQPIVPLTPILVCANVLERVNSFKYLGVWITKDLTWFKACE